MIMIQNMPSITTEFSHEVAPGTYSVRAENADCNATSTTATIRG